MSQFTFEREKYIGILSFLVEDCFGESREIEVKFIDFDEFSYNMKLHHNGDHNELFDMEVHNVQFNGISFKGQQGSERFEVNMIDGFNRATIIFDETKFTGFKNDKLKRINAILLED